jgi:hypothetical protein
MVASSHPPLSDVMTERPCELLHMDLVGQLVCDLRVGSGTSLLCWTTTLGMCGCSFLKRKGRRLVLFEILSSGQGTRGTEVPSQRSVVTMAQNSKNLASKPFVMTWVLNPSLLVCIRLSEWRGGKEKHDLVRDGSDYAR